mgnify:CR=1 FL=1
MSIEQALARVDLLEQALLQERERYRALEAKTREIEAERDRVRLAYQEAVIAIELLRRRIESAKAERVDTKQLELEFETKLKALDELAGKLTAEASEPPAPPPPKTREPRKPTGRRDLADDSTLPIERVEVTDPEMERLVAEGKAERFGFDEESSKVAHRRASKVRLVLARALYRIGKLEGIVPSDMPSADDLTPPSDVAPVEPAATSETSDTTARSETATSETTARSETATNTPAPARCIDRRHGTTLVTATMPPSIIRRSIGAPSLYASIVAQKLNRGLPLYRQEDQLRLDGFPLARGTMSRWLFDLGTETGETVVAAMWAEAKEHAFCMSTDATGVLVQPEPRPDGKRQACKHGHYFCVIADRDHVFFEYTPREDSKAVMRIFRGYAGYVQADAKSVFNILFRDPDEEPPDDPELAPDGAKREEVGCMTHGRRKFFECAVATKSVVAREALVRIHRLYEHEEKWRKLSPSQRREMRQRIAKPELDDLFAWVNLLYAEMKHQRGLLTSALGYFHRHQAALMRYLDEGRLSIDNNHTERQIKTLVLGRKAWLFIGSDDHGQPMGNLLALVASCKLHGLDPEAYLRDLFCVLPQWPSDRYLELAPKYWRATRARLVDAELAREITWLTIPVAPLDIAALRTPPSA